MTLFSRFISLIFSGLLVLALLIANGCGNGYIIPETSTLASTTTAASTKAVTSYTLAGSKGIIDETNKTIKVTVPFGSALTSLVATFVQNGSKALVGTTEQLSGVTANDFSSPLTLVIQASDGTSASYTVTVSVALANAKAITAFSLGGATGTINQANLTIAVNLPFGTNLTNLIATFSTTGTNVSVGSVTQTSGTTTNNFSNAVVYTVTAANGSKQNYTVTVLVASARTSTMASFSINAVLGLINETAKTIVVTLPFNTNVTALVATFAHTGNSVRVGTINGAVQTTAVTANNFTTTVDYFVIAADASFSRYTVTIALAAPVWLGTGSLNNRRESITGNLLNNGQVLIAGGTNTAVPNQTNTAELFNPATNVWTTTTVMNTIRANHTSTTLADGQVLVAGGRTGAGPVLSNTGEVYDPATVTWTPTVAANMTFARQNHAAVLLLDGRVLIMGGSDAAPLALGSTEIYTPGTNNFAAGGAMGTLRQNPNAQRLSDGTGRVLVTGGINGAASIITAEMYTPGTNTWAAAAPMTQAARVFHASVVLNDGRILVAGGQTAAGTTTALSEIYNPITNAWAATGTMTTARQGHSLLMLRNGLVLACGGTANAGAAMNSCETYNPATGVWTASVNMVNARTLFAAVQLNDGRILNAGGNAAAATLDDSEAMR